MTPSAPLGATGGRSDRVKCPTCNRPFADAIALARHAQRTVPCAGTSKTRVGEPCDTCVTRPKTVCRFHGGAAPQVRAAVESRRSSQRAERAVAEFALARDIEPQRALLEALHRWAGVVAYLGGVIGDFTSDDDLKQLSRGSEQFERPAVWVELYNTGLREMAKVAKACLDAGIDERRIALAEEHGRTLDGVLRRVLTAVFSGLAALGLRADVLEEFQREQLPAIVRAAVMAIVYDRPEGLAS